MKLPDWLKNEKGTINPKISNEECFKYTLIALLYNKEINSLSTKMFQQIKKFHFHVTKIHF